MTLPFTILPTVAGDAAPLLAVSRRADAMLAAHGHPLIGQGPTGSIEDMAALLGMGTSFTALCDGRQVGFAVLGALGDIAWLTELAVDADFGGRGIGSALLDAAVAHARADGYGAIGLTTFRDVPFNAPFYGRRGFAAVEGAALEPPLRDIVERECPAGIDPATRTLMIRHLQPGDDPA